jgi:hypothetical protein
MKLDYDFIKGILGAIVESDSHLVTNVQIAKAVEVDLKDTAQFDKFAGHVKLLGDNACIESQAENFGFGRTMGGDYYFEAHYRLTAQGYEFLDMLKNQSVLNKIKSYGVSTALELGKELLKQAVLGAAR